MMRDRQYTNFDITISGDSPPYAVLVSYRGLSGASTFNQDALNAVWQEYLALLGDPYQSPGEALLAEIGSRLFSELMRDNVRDLWSQARSDLDDGGRLRLRLILHPPPVAALPWEALHDPRRNQSLGADAIISLVRTQNQVSYVARPRALEATLPLTVLLVTVESPDLPAADAGSLDTGPRAEGQAMPRESGQIRTVAAGLPSGRMKLESLDGRVTIQQIRERLLATRPDILHIIGHGNEDGLLLWVDDAPALVSASTLRAVLQQAETVKLVFLNACLGGRVDSTRPFAGIAHQLLQSGLPAVIAMRYEILDTAAAAFAGSVYEALVTGPGRGYIDAAVSAARSNLYINDPDRVDYATPILWLNAESGRLLPFDDERRGIEDAPATSATPPRFVSPRPQLEFRLQEKEAWNRALPAAISDPHLPFEYQRRRRIVGLLLKILQHAAVEQEEGKSIDIRALQRRLENFEEERSHIQNILDYAPDRS